MYYVKRYLPLPYFVDLNNKILFRLKLMYYVSAKTNLPHFTGRILKVNAIYNLWFTHNYIHIDSIFTLT